MWFSLGQFIKDLSIYRSAIMGIAILAIILFHQDFLSSTPWNFFHYYGYWGVDVFLLLSGMGLVNSLQKNTLKVYYQRRVSRLLPSCIFVGVLKCFVFLILSATFILPKGLSLNWLSPFSLDLWYIRAIIVYYIVSPWLYKYLQKKPLLTMSAIFAVFLINEFCFRIHDAESPTWIIERLPVFSIGMLLIIRKELQSTWSLLCSMAFLMTAVAIAGVFKGDIHTTLPWGIMMFALAFGTTAMVFLCILLLKHLPQACIRPLNWLGGISLELYLVHEFIFNLMAQTTGISWNEATLFSLSFILSITVAYLSKKIINFIFSKI